MPEFTCIYCNKLSYSWQYNTTVCKDKECKNKKAREFYENNKKSKPCSKCKIEFIGTYRQILCESCQEIPIECFVEVERTVLCKKCDTVVGSEQVKLGKHIAKEPIKPVHGLIDCPACLAHSRTLISESKKGEKNPMWVGGEKFHKRQKKFATKEEARKSMSERMKQHNPMFNPETCKKVSATIKQKVANGEQVYPKGSAHGGWKGYRDRAQTIRTRLYKAWVFPILERDKFTCTSCGKNKVRLEVHHDKEPFRDILAKFCDESLYRMELEKFEQIIEQVVNYHLTEQVSGITLCTECHRNVDKLRK